MLYTHFTISYIRAADYRYFGTTKIISLSIFTFTSAAYH